jgi:hypothetical protein
MIRALRAARRSAVKARAFGPPTPALSRPHAHHRPRRAKERALRARSSRPSSGYEGFAVSAGDEPLGGGNSHQVVRAALGGAPLPEERLSEEISELDEQLEIVSGGRSRAGALLVVEGVLAPMRPPRCSDRRR